MAKLSNEKSPSTVSPTSTSTEPTVSERIPSREDASIEDGKCKPNIGKGKDKHDKGVKHQAKYGMFTNHAGLG